MWQKLLPFKKEILTGALVVVAVIAGGYAYNNSQERLTESARARGELERKLEENRRLLEALERDSRQNIMRLEELQERVTDSNKYSLDLEQTLSEHNLTALAAAKPGLIERRINNETEELFRDLTNISNDGLRRGEPETTGDSLSPSDS